MHNFFLDADKWRAPYTLDGQEARHLSKALRIRPGKTVRLLDGAGRTGEFAVAEVTKNNVELTALKITEHPRPQGRCFLAAAYTKATRRSWLLEKSVELEAGGIWFWQAEHSQAKVPDAGKENWQEQLIAGAKQCFNPWLPELRTFPNGAAALAAEVKNFSRAFLLWEDESTGNMLRFEYISLPTSPPPQNNNDTLFIMGPEGGLTHQEVKIFQDNGCKSVSLGNRVLRWETAALLCLGLGFWVRQLSLSRE